MLSSYMRFEVVKTWPPFASRAIARVWTGGADVANLIAYAW